MALIYCTNCGRQISDKASACPHCGTSFIPDEGGAPMSSGPESQSNNSTTIAIAAVALVALAALAVGGFFIYRHSQSVSEQISSINENIRDHDVIVEHDSYPMANDNTLDADHRFIEQMIPTLTSQYLTREELYNYDSRMLRLMRNAIFATHNYKFKSDDLIEFYTQYDWYSPTYTDVTRQLSQVELYNINLIKKYE